MFRRYVRNEHVFIARRLTPALLVGFLLLASPLWAQVTLPPITVGAGLQTSFAHTDPDGGKYTDQFLVNSARLYVNGSATEDIKFMFNTEYDGVTNKIGVLDAVARFEPSPKFNIWAGRFIAPSDRANLYGPYYSHHWAVYTDGIQDGYPSVATGRSNGVAYWGDFGKVKVSGGAFDGASVNGNTDVIGAGRVQIDFWDAEAGYYLNGSYYGGKNLLAIGGATQVQSSKTATTVDFLLEKKLPNEGVVSIESEYANYHEFGGYDSRYTRSQGAYALASYLFPTQVGIGKFEVLGKFARARFTKGITPNYGQNTAEVNFNYVIREFNARVMTFYKDTSFSAVKTDFWQAGVGFQIQM